MITTYNLEKYIAVALESVLSQETEYEYEILVGDDGSDDDTVNIIREYQAKYPDKISLYVMPRDNEEQVDKIKRASLNRLNLWEHATGEYCSFLDGDDYYIDNKRLEKMVKILDDPKNKDCVMCAHNLNLVYESDGSEAPLLRAQKSHKYDLKDYWPLMFVQANALMFRNIYNETKKDFVLTDSFDDNMITFWLFKFGKMYYCPDIMGAYRQLEGSSWNERDIGKQMRVNLDELWLENKVNIDARKYSITRHYKEIEYFIKHNDLINADEKEKISSIYQASKRSYYLAKCRRGILKLFKQY